MLEFKIKVEVTGLEKLVDVLTALTGGNILLPKQEQPAASQPPQAVQQSIPVQQPITSIPIQSVPQQAVPVQQPVMATQTGVPTVPASTMPTAIPTTMVAQEFTQDQLAVAAAGLVNQGKQLQLMGILQRFGIQSMVELTKESYGAFAQALRAEGAVI